MYSKIQGELFFDTHVGCFYQFIIDKKKRFNFYLNPQGSDSSNDLK
jgi:hypothetical protein